MVCLKNSLTNLNLHDFKINMIIVQNAVEFSVTFPFYSQLQCPVKRGCAAIPRLTILQRCIASLL